MNYNGTKFYFPDCLCDNKLVYANYKSSGSSLGILFDYLAGSCAENARVEECRCPAEPDAVQFSNTFITHCTLPAMVPLFPSPLDKLRRCLTSQENEVFVVALVLD